jgi:predicted enzyme related to lactoylglutathione lyase
MANPVVHFEVIGADGAKLQQFYTQLFDWKLNVVEPGNYGLLERGDGGIGGGIAASDDSNARGVTIYVQVEDLQAALDKAERLGGRTVVPPTEIPDMVTFAQFVDPEGNRIGLIKG